MFTRRLLVGLCGLLLAVAGVGAWQIWLLLRPIPLPPLQTAQPSPPDPNAPGVIEVERDGPTETLDELVLKSDAVLLISLESTKTDRLDVGRIGGPYPFTVYHFTVRQAAKGDFRPLDKVSVARLGGPNSYESDFPRPGLGEQFVVFVKWWPEMKVYRHLYGPETMRIVNRKVQPLSLRYEGLQGRDVMEFMRDLGRMTSNVNLSAARPSVGVGAATCEAGRDDQPQH